MHSPFSDTLRYQIGKKSLHILCIYKYIYIPSVLRLYPEYGRYIIHFHLHPNIISSCFCKVIWKCKIFHDYTYWSHLDLECTYIYNIHMCVNTYVYVFTYMFYMYTYIYPYIYTHMYIYIYICIYTVTLYYPQQNSLFFSVQGQLIDLLSPGSCLVVAPRGRPSHLEYI